MAIVLTAFNAVQTRVPYVKPPDLQRMFTSIPRARLDFIVNAGVVPLKPVNDDQNVQVIVLLPLQFAYRLISSTCSIRQDSASFWDENAQLQITNAMRGQPAGVTTRHPVPSRLTNSFSVITPERIWFTSATEAAPTFIVQSILPNTQAGLDWRFSNIIDPAAAAGVINFFASFYEYDIEQVQMYPPLVPSLTYALA